MREIKFRARAKSDGEWAYGYYSVRGDESFISFMNINHQGQDVEVLPETVGQFTGLKDKNGREIYEGDIVHTRYGAKGGQHTIVREMSMYGLTFERVGGLSAYFYWNLPQRDTIEVIGNIYEGLYSGEKCDIIEEWKSSTGKQSQAPSKDTKLAKKPSGSIEQGYFNIYGNPELLEMKQ